MKKGFTLIELLAVISILAIIILLSVPNLLKAIKGNKEKTLDKTKGLIVAAAKNYVVDYDIDTPNVIGLDDLCGTYINCPIKNPVTEEDIDGCVKITISSEIENYTFIDNPSECTGGTNSTKLTLKVNLNGGVTTQTFNETYNRYSSLTLVRPTKEDWVFIGWRVTKGNAEVNTNTLQFKATDVEIDALWGKNVELTLDLDGGSSSQVLNNPYITNTNIELVSPTKTGYSFTGWELVSGDSIISGNNITFGLENTTIKATYGIGSYVCNAGEYLKKGETSCTTCEANSYCPGGTYPYNPSEDQGITRCPGSMTSVSGSSAQTQCKITCSAGEYLKKGETSCTSCPAGRYCLGGEYSYNEDEDQGIRGLCAKGSYSEAGASSCIACQNGLTTGTIGLNKCNVYCSNKSNVATWNKSSWATNNIVNGECSIEKCNTGYKLKNNNCIGYVYGYGTITNPSQGTTNYSSLNRRVFVKYSTDLEERSVCTLYGGSLHCFEINKYTTTKSSMTSLFGASNCTITSTSIYCIIPGTPNWSCYAEENGYVGCYWESGSNYDQCYKKSDGHLACNN